VRQENDNVIRSFAVADTLSLLQDRLQLTLGARHQRVNQKMKGYDERRHSHAGPGGQALGRGSVLLRQLHRGAEPGLEVGSTYANAGETFAPYKSKQMEAGVKWRRAGWTNTLSLFQIEKPSTTIDTAANTLKLNGEQRNRGVEWNTFGAAPPVCACWAASRTCSPS
jgi:iron complex outermembrane receptor protein